MEYIFKVGFYKTYFMEKITWIPCSVETNTVIAGSISICVHLSQSHS